MLLWQFLSSNVWCLNVCIAAAILVHHGACLCSKRQNGKLVTLRYNSINIPHHMSAKPLQHAAGGSSLLSLFFCLSVCLCLLSQSHWLFHCILTDTLGQWVPPFLPLLHFFARNSAEGTFFQRVISEIVRRTMQGAVHTPVIDYEQIWCGTQIRQILFHRRGKFKKHPYYSHQAPIMNGFFLFYLETGLQFKQQPRLIPCSFHKRIIMLF